MLVANPNPQSEIKNICMADQDGDHNLDPTTAYLVKESLHGGTIRAVCKTHQREEDCVCSLNLLISLGLIDEHQTLEDCLEILKTKADELLSLAKQLQELTEDAKYENIQDKLKALRILLFSI